MTRVDEAATAEKWNGLRQLERALPSAYYSDPSHYERELKKIWYRNWLYLCRASTLPDPLSYRTFTIGNQPILLLRDEDGELRAFYNTCRHRGSLLCTEPEGRLRTRAITCPYHSWTYDLRGNLRGVPTYGRPKPVEVHDFPLYSLALREWNGFIFVNLNAQAAQPFEASVVPGIDTLDRWPWQDLVVGHTLTQTLQCNWKVFWENYNECLHCPNLHPALSALVPLYQRAIMDERDDPQWSDYADSKDPRYKLGLRAGASSWSCDGQAGRHVFPGLTAAERDTGFHFVTSVPSLYVIAHVDYVRAVRVRPRGPEQMEFQAEWLFPRAALADPTFDPRNSIDMPSQVLAEDGAACELAQRGMRALSHASGVLLPEEYELHAFHRWVTRELDRP